MSSTDHHPADGPERRPVRLALLLPVLLILLFHLTGTANPAEAAGPSPTPEPDPLAMPVLPDNPGPIDLGKVTYYYHCMPCHGDKGQGLTDEWRSVWVEDHQNCWSRGCHAGKPDDEGFPIPRYVPPVMPPFASLARFVSPDALTEFLHADHPPQSPGVLDEADCRNLAAFLTHEAPQAPALAAETSFADAGAASATSAGVVRAAIALVVTLGLAWLIGWREPR
jgi:hypothetical protein